MLDEPAGESTLAMLRMRHHAANQRMSIDQLHHRRGNCNLPPRCRFAEDHSPAATAISPVSDDRWPRPSLLTFEAVVLRFGSPLAALSHPGLAREQLAQKAIQCLLLHRRIRLLLESVVVTAVDAELRLDRKPLEQRLATYVSIRRQSCCGWEVRWFRGRSANNARTRSSSPRRTLWRRRLNVVEHLSRDTTSSVGIYDESLL